MNKESVSALLDGEHSPAELDRLLAELDQDPALRREFTRQTLAREALRGTRVRAADPGFAARVMAAIERDGSAVRPSRSRIPQAWMALGAAAAVAAIAVLVLRPDRAPVPTPETATPVVNADNAQLRHYLMAYSQSRAQHGIGGTLGYARYAAYSASQDGDR